MNAIHLLSTQPWVERLGSTLLHVLWQGVLIAAVYAAARRRAARPNARYVLACAALALMAAAPLLTWTWLGPPAADSKIASFTAPLSSTASPTVRDVPTAIMAEVSRSGPSAFLFWVVAVWLAGAIVFWLRLLGGWVWAGRLRSRFVRPAPAEWQQAVRSLQVRIRVSRPIRLLVSSLAPVPTVVGWLRPVVLVPVGALAGLPAGQIEALLLHELAHIRRHDYLINIVQSLIESLLFYHPAVWWISGNIRAERELCCDDLAVSVTGDVLTYARALAELASAPPLPFSPVVAANGGALAHRVARLLGQSRPAPRTVSGPGVAAGAVILAVTAFAVFGQTAARPQFEAASVKPSAGRGFMMVRPLPGRLTAAANLRLLMQNAYTVQPFQIVGGPAWVDSDRFEIEAKAEGEVSRPQMFLMLQSLLAERFQLRIHREARELPVYALVAAKSGLKLPPPKAGACENAPPGEPLGWAGGRMQPPGGGQPPLPRCGSVSVRLEASGAQMQGGNVSMPELVRVLSMVMGRAVVDKTGFSRPFDVRLNFLPDPSTSALPPPPPDSAAAVDSAYPSIVTALPEQLGLRLESSKGAVDVIVIDHVEKPSAN